MAGAMIVPGFEYFDHDADVGIRVHAGSFEELLSTAARALVSWIGPEPGRPEGAACDVFVEAEDHAGLLVRWLQEVLYRFQVDRFYFTGTTSLTVEGCCLRARLFGRTWGEWDAGSYQEVKAVTYHQLEVRQACDVWQATFILDL